MAEEIIDLRDRIEKMRIQIDIFPLRMSVISRTK